MQRPTRLTATFVRTITEPGRYGDGRGGYGLSLLVKATATGRVSRTWSQRLRLNGRPVNVGLGGFPLVRLDEAREAALTNARLVRSGVDPLADKRRKVAVPSFQEAAERVIALHVPSWKDGSRTAGIWRGRLSEYAYPSIGNVKVDALTPADVIDVLTPIWATRRETARKVRQYIGAVLSWSVAQGFRTDNPSGAAITAALPKAGGQTVHQRALPFADVPAALAKVRESDAAPTTKLAVAFLTLTAGALGRDTSGDVGGDRPGLGDVDHPGGAHEDRARASRPAQLVGAGRLRARPRVRRRLGPRVRVANGTRAERQYAKQALPRARHRRDSPRHA